MADPTLILRRANVSRKGGTWSEHDFDVFDGDRDVGRIYRVPHASPESSGSRVSCSRSPSERATGMRCRWTRPRSRSGRGIFAHTKIGSNLALLPNGAAKAGA